MVPAPLKMTANFRTYVSGVREMHLLAASGKEDSPEADAIRDALDEPWEALSEVERARVGNLSEDLYSLLEPLPARQPMNDEINARLDEAREARRRGEWDRALDLVRGCAAYIDPALLSYLRGSIWLESGDADTAVLFLEHAASLDPANQHYRSLWLSAMGRPGLLESKAALAN